MTQKSKSEQQSAFSWWLRTGRLPSVRDEGGIELKYNPWHDPFDGRFSFAGSGSNHRAGEARSVNRDTPRIAKHPKVEAPRAKSMFESRRRNPPNPAAEFVGGVGDGVYNVAKEAATAAYSALTTNPILTARNVGLGFAGSIDKAIDAEDTPARVQISRAVDAAANASARDTGRATGAVVGNAALAIAPGAALAKVSALRRLRMAPHRPSYDPPNLGWAKETLTSDKPWKAYNDSATGGRPGQAPTLKRRMPDGSERSVKFDGVQGDYVIDRKWSVSGRPRAVAQALRQSDVLAQHKLFGTWELPTQAKRDAAIKLLKKLNVTNIKVRVVEP